MGLLRPLPKSAQGQEYILVIVDYAKRYPEAILLWKTTSKIIEKELKLLYSPLGILKGILTDQEPLFVCILMKDLCQWLVVKKNCPLLFITPKLVAW